MSIRRIKDIVCEYYGKYQTWSLLQETTIRRIQSLGYVVNIDNSTSNVLIPLDSFWDWQYEWGAKQEEDFQTLKDNLCNAPILSSPDGPNNFVVYYDALNKGFRCVLMQKGKEIAYASRQLKIHEKNYATQYLELGVVVFALKTWRHYLYWMKSVIYTDHKSLQHIFDQIGVKYASESGVKDKILTVQSEASKVENAPAEILHGLDQQIKKNKDGDQHAHIMHHLESLLTISLDNLCLDNLDIFEEDLENQSLRKSLSLFEL
ncbi:putative reverse transcriptase domain-containing protein [Tanacetum coccineum]|uniref:Reverse transcriptase domain-containing protein n=1 Tax=Tanacetum coccineum TaxID=301880 RepID=A0ABQ5CQS5_9ASTR